MKKIKQWLRSWKRHSGRRKSHDTAEDDTVIDISNELVLLPVERPSALTPRSSEEHLLWESTACSSMFFTKLPIEIRREIYMIAFGNRTIHIDLRHNQWESYNEGINSTEVHLPEISKVQYLH